MAKIKLVLKRRGFEFADNVDSISVGGEEILCTAINLAFSADGMEHITFTVPMNGIDLEFLEDKAYETSHD